MLSGRSTRGTGPGEPLPPGSPSTSLLESRDSAFVCRSRPHRPPSARADLITAAPFGGRVVLRKTAGSPAPSSILGTTPARRLKEPCAHDQHLQARQVFRRTHPVRGRL